MVSQQGCWRPAPRNSHIFFIHPSVIPKGPSQYLTSGQLPLLSLYKKNWTQSLPSCCPHIHNNEVLEKLLLNIILTVVSPQLYPFQFASMTWSMPASPPPSVPGLPRSVCQGSLCGLPLHFKHQPEGSDDPVPTLAQHALLSDPPHSQFLHWQAASVASW